MPITNEQRKARVTSIGSSDVPALFGVSPWTTAYDVWLEKTEKLEGQPPEAPWLANGNLFEPVIMDWAERELEDHIVRDVHIEAPDFHLAANIDGVTQKTSFPVEGKRVGGWGQWSDSFDPDVTDGVPEYVIYQSHVHMICLETDGFSPDRTYVPVYLNRRDQFHMFQVPRNDDLVDAIKEECVNFWENHVQADTPPEDSLPSYDVCKRIRRPPNKTIQIDPAFLQVWNSHRAKRLELEKLEKDAYQELVAQMGDAERAECGDLGAVTFFSQKSAAVIDRNAMKRDGVWDTYADLTRTHRVLRPPKKKKEKS